MENGTEIKTDIRFKVSERNDFLEKSFFYAAGFGLTVAVINTPVRFGQTVDLGLWSDFVKDNESIRFVSNHVKGAGQAILYSQVGNLLVGQICMERQENQHMKETGEHINVPVQDRSILIGTSCLVGGFAWENFSQSNNVNGAFDSTDMLLYGVGVCMLVGYNKLMSRIADFRFPEVANIRGKSQRKPSI